MRSGGRLSVRLGVAWVGKRCRLLLLLVVEEKVGRVFAEPRWCATWFRGLFVVGEL